MVLIKIKFPESEYIINRDKFVINSLYPIGFKESNIKGCFMYLLGAYQDYDDCFVYLQIMFQVDDPLEYDMLKKHPNYIPNYDNNMEKKSVYLYMISEMNNTNLYATDFIMHSDKPGYHSAHAIRQNEDKTAEALDLYIPQNTFIRLKIFMENLNVKSVVFPCEIFANPKFNSPKFVTIEEIERGETAYAANKQLFVDTHYILYSGPDSYKCNYRSFINPDKTLTNELDQDMYTGQYSVHYYIEYMVRDEDDVLLIYDAPKFRYEKEEEKLNEDVIVCRIPAKLVEKTNFINQFNKIYE